jgi:hypothetical protein
MRLSKEKKDKISEQILSHLFHSFPKQLFTAEIAKEIARDEEFIKNILFELQEKKLVVNIRKNEDGKLFVRRLRWQLSPMAYGAYSNKSI